MPSSMSVGQSSLLVLTNHVYAKKEDGLFYPGSIEGKHNENYVVVFADNTKEMLPEEYITWLAFCGLPPTSWPKNPIIQPTIATDKEFDGPFVKYFDDKTGQKPASLTILKDEDIEKFPADTKWSYQSSSRKCYRPRKRPFKLNSDETGEEDIHDLTLMRSSVLRINTKALSKGKESNGDVGLVPVEDKNRELLPPSPFQQTPKCKKNKRTNFRSMLAPRTADNLFEMTRCSCGSLGMPKFEPKFCRCTHEEEEIEAESLEYYGRPTYTSPYQHRPYPNMEWYGPPHFNQSSPTSPITPSSLTSPIEHDPQQGMRPFWPAPHHVRDGLGPRFDLPLFGHDPYGIRVVHEEWKESANGVGPGKKRRKDGLKKCRKVYGVYNRSLWCTQCKWKKACTRFRA